MPIQAHKWEKIKLRVIPKQEVLAVIINRLNKDDGKFELFWQCNFKKPAVHYRRGLRGRPVTHRRDTVKQQKLTKTLILNTKITNIPTNLP